MAIFTQSNHIIAGIYPVADFLSTTVYSDVYNMENADHITFVIMTGANAGGDSDVTVEACSTAAAAATTAIAFNYRTCASSTTEDTYGALTAAGTGGFTTSQTANYMYFIEVDAQDVNATGYNFVRVKAVEKTDAAVTGTMFAILSGLRNQGATLPESIS